jgi:hypothetical protein
LEGAEAALSSAQAQVERMQGALKPFADVCVGRESLNDDAEIEIRRSPELLEHGPGPNVNRARLLMREFRAARQALNPEETKS